MKRNILFLSSGLLLVDQLIKMLVMNTMYLYQSIKVIPNFIKDFALYYFAKYSKLNQTTVFSNLGLVKVPECYGEYIDNIGVVSSTEDLHLVSCSFKDKLQLAFTSHYDNKEIERNFVKYLKQDVKSKLNIISNIGSDQDE